MSTTDTQLSQEEIDAVMPHWAVGHVLFTRPTGGTANASVIVVTRKGQFVLKRRNPRYCGPGEREYDHHVMHRLYRSGLPVPKVVHTREASRWVEYRDKTYELFEFIDATTHIARNDAQVAEAGAVLVQFHQATKALDPPGQKHFGRFWDPADARNFLERFIQQAHSDEKSASDPPDAAKALEELITVCEDVARHVPDSTYSDLPSPIIHGDWHPWNVSWSDDTIAGIFDFDWVDRQPRLVDIADGLLYFCPLREDLPDSPDIWQLSEAIEPDEHRLGVFLAAYEELASLTDRELQLLPHFARIRWIYSRVDAADRKVASEQQLHFILRDVKVPLKWLDAHTEFFAGRQWA
ncbi:MAG: phosphotransferase [Armatimonadota bacterium]